MSKSYSIPDHLAILPLPPGQVLFPTLILSVQLASKHSIALLQSVIREADQRPGNSALIIGCAPVRPISPEQDGQKPLTGALKRIRGDNIAPAITPPASSDSEGEDDKSANWKVGRVRQEAQANGKPAPEDLFEFGTAARIVRVERLSTGGFVVVLEGLARISLSLSDFTPPSLPFHETRITLHPPTPLPSTSTTLIESLQEITTTLLATLASSSPLSALLTRRLRSLSLNLSPETAPALVDALMGSIPSNGTTGLTFSDKLTILSLVDPEKRVEHAIEVLGRVNEGLGLKKRIGERVDQSLSRKQREFVLLQQLAAIRQELEELAAKDGGGSALGGAAGRALGGKKVVGGGGEDEDEDEGDDMVELEKAIKAKSWTEESRKVALRELKRLKKSPPQGAEHGVIRNYLDWLLALPWNDSTPLPLSRDFITAARDKLDADHYGLEPVKKRLLQWLAVLRLKQEAWERDNPPQIAPSSETESTTTSPPSESKELVLHSSDPAAAATPSPAPPAPITTTPKPRDKGPILLLCGPPGTGKTSIARSLAEAMGRKFARISLGGVRDEAEIRGHRRTYVAALPGAIAKALRKTGVNNPVILLDEIDKLGMSNHSGDPSAALLEVLDPEQNWSFEDHYLGIPLDLSSVLFIATANSLDTISEPLFDRMETIELSGYTHDEKSSIASTYLIPKQLKANSLPPHLLSLPPSVLTTLITSYTHEAGVRTLERQIGAVVRAKAVEYAEARDRADGDEVKGGYVKEVTEGGLEKFLGLKKFEREEEGEGVVGVSTGLSYQGSGNGGILHIESTSMPGSGGFHLTGQLGEVISESAHLAFAWVKSHAYELGISSSRNEDVFSNLDLHVHLPSGSIRKDGPSAGVAMVVAMVSLMRNLRPLPHTAMTGEITLRGLVTPVGGIKEKLLGAHRAGIRTLILPFKNRRDVLQDLPKSIQDELKIVYVRNIWEAVETAFGEQLWEMSEDGGRGVRERGGGWAGEARL